MSGQHETPTLPTGPTGRELASPTGSGLWQPGDQYDDYTDDELDEVDDGWCDPNEAKDELVLDCGTPGCLMPGEHFRSECHTVEDMEAMEEEAKRTDVPNS
jgi:hypothetical protein